LCVRPFKADEFSTSFCVALIATIAASYPLPSQDATVASALDRSTEEKPAPDAQPSLYPKHSKAKVKDDSASAIDAQEIEFPRPSSTSVKRATQ
jgi:hypothetical protein